ncbi:MAG: helix-turn-helix domain-containing protein [Saccharothrix sp.]|nr:helix-turn-helix domain-containing protein [Saccharothrix sp.]
MTRHDEPPTATPTLRSRLFGGELRRFRQAAGLTVAELAALTNQEPDAVRQLESGLGTAEFKPEAGVWCPWGILTTSVINTLCRDAERIDLFAPLGIHPALEQLDQDRCTAYVLEEVAVSRNDVTLRPIRHGGDVYPGIDHQPLTRFVLPDGPAVVLYAYLHAVYFTDEEQHLLGAYTLFERLAEFTGSAGA